jgi:hypothetical protein
MPKELLNCADVIARLKQVSGEGVPQLMTTGHPGNICIPHRLIDGSLHRLFPQMVLRKNPRARVDGAPVRGVDILPTGLALRSGIFPTRRIWNFGNSDSISDVEPVKFPRTQQLPLQWLVQRLGKYAHSVFAAPTRAHHQRTAFEIHLLHPQSHPLQQPKPAAVEHLCDEPLRTPQMSQQGPNFTLAQDVRHARGALGPHNAVNPTDVGIQYVTVQEQERCEGLILGSRRNVSLDHQVGEEGSNLLFAHLRRMPFAKEQDKKTNPVNVGLFGPQL